VDGVALWVDENN